MLIVNLSYKLRHKSFDCRFSHEEKWGHREGGLLQNAWTTRNLIFQFERHLFPTPSHKVWQAFQTGFYPQFLLDALRRNDGIVEDPQGCFYCGKPFSSSNLGDMSVDNVFPWLDSPDFFTQTVVSCFSCNIKKARKHPIDFLCDESALTRENLIECAAAKLAEQIPHDIALTAATKFLDEMRWGSEKVCLWNLEPYAIANPNRCKLSSQQLSLI